jgi:hypothetical protein
LAELGPSHLPLDWRWQSYSNLHAKLFALLELGSGPGLADNAVNWKTGVEQELTEAQGELCRLQSEFLDSLQREPADSPLL